MKKIPPRLLLVIAAVLSIIAAILTYSLLSKKAPISGPSEDNVPVIVATRAIGAETEIKEEMLKVVYLPKDIAQSDAFKNTADVLGKKTVQSINAGDQVTRRRFSVPMNKSLLISIPNDKRAVTIPVDDVSSIAGFVKPGQYVDVINVVGKSGNVPTVGKMILQNVLVLGTGQRDMTNSNSKAESVKTVTLAVDPRDAVRLRVAQQENGRISLALRPLKPEEEEVMGTLVVGSGAQMVTSVGGATPSVGQASPAITVIRGTGK